MRIRTFQWMAAVLATTGMVIPSAALAETGRQIFDDVALRPGGVLVGSVVDHNGLPQPAVAVSVCQRDAEVVRTVTNEQGQFAVEGLRGGQYSLVTPQHTVAIRAWSPQTAPPVAKSQVMLVQADQVVRGVQVPMFGNVSTGTLIGVGVGVTALGVGIGFAVANDDDNS